MPSWFSSLETVVRIQSVAAWIGVAGAVLAVLGGIFAYFLGIQATQLREQVTGERLESTRADLREKQRAGLAELEQTRQLLLQSEERGEAFADRIESLEKQLRQARATTVAARLKAHEAEERAAAASPVAPSDSSGGREGRISLRQRRKFLKAMEGKPAGELTLVAEAGNLESVSLAKELESLLKEAGWRPTYAEATFRKPPQGLSFVVRSQQTMPESAVALSIGLAIIDLMPMPARVLINPSRPPGFLGIVVGPAGK
ncbi:MAG: hypothetical protein ACE5JX_18430 [Acidobacteriota bacterium]